MRKRQDGVIPGFVLNSGLDKEKAISTNTDDALVIPGLSVNDVRDIIESKDRVGPEQVQRIQQSEIHQSFGPERTLGETK
jgi:hypothetical protein